MATEYKHQIFAKTGELEIVVPLKFSVDALILQLVWAATHGIAKRYLFMLVPLIACIWGIASIDQDGLFVALGIITILVFNIYFPMYANFWYSASLLESGYELVYETKSPSADEALAKYKNWQMTHNKRMQSDPAKLGR